MALHSNKLPVPVIDNSMAQTVKCFGIMTFNKVDTLVSFIDIENEKNACSMSNANNIILFVQRKLLLLTMGGEQAACG